MTKSPWSTPFTPAPFPGAPRDYVPVTKVHKPRRALRRAALAATIAAAAIALFVYPTIGLTALALGVVAASVWAGGKLADKHEAKNDNH
ncbi:hypothetical protein [Rhizobium leucaenae]|uniref:hypothetical protein n=1 Tax=Rhizobium leucaenae TaxID=29450 RepID=UPI001617D46E|nr:hypothetical protein [Rhizobium leucaenae]MBB6299950.1 glucose uptake protein GlcU [Rhizobium leucaenae]